MDNVLYIRIQRQIEINVQVKLEIKIYNFINKVAGLT